MTKEEFVKEQMKLSKEDIIANYWYTYQDNVEKLGIEHQLNLKDKEIERLNKERKEFIKFGIEDERTIDRLKYKLNKIEESAKFADLIYSTHLLEIIGDEDLETNEEYFKGCLNDLKSIYESLCYSAPEMTPVFLGQMKEIFDDIEEVVGVDKE